MTSQANTIVLSVMAALLLAVAVLAYNILRDIAAHFRLEREQREEWERLFAIGATSKRFDEWKNEDDRRRAFGIGELGECGVRCRTGEKESRKGGRKP